MFAIVTLLCTCCLLDSDSLLPHLACRDYTNAEKYQVDYYLFRFSLSDKSQTKTFDFRFHQHSKFLSNTRLSVLSFLKNIVDVDLPRKVSTLLLKPQK